MTEGAGSETGAPGAVSMRPPAAREGGEHGLVLRRHFAFELPYALSRALSPTPQSLAMCLIFAQVGEAGAAHWNAGFIRQTLMAKPLPTKVGVPRQGFGSPTRFQ
jgi:hypothetical protein